MNSHSNTGEKIPSHIPIGEKTAEMIIQKIGGTTITSYMDSIFGIPSTAHILGGAIMGMDAESGVIDRNGKLHGYSNFYVVDGSIIPVNLGVNPSLTITALAEYIMDKFPDKS